MGQSVVKEAVACDSSYLLSADLSATSQDAEAEGTPKSFTIAAPHRDLKGLPGSSHGDGWAEDSTAQSTALVRTHLVVQHVSYRHPLNHSTTCTLDAGL